MKEFEKLLILAMAILLASIICVGGTSEHFRIEKGGQLSRVLGDERMIPNLISVLRDRSKLKTQSQFKKQLFARQSDQEESANSASMDTDPKLFDLLISALGKSEREDAKRNRQTKPSTKPCYWSLVACY